ncbi:MAG: hypothetical protein A2748_02495 [Candidatus Wildermuthbacteria bacterium RIFCSPHIGHO2_01_FULL_45_20]|nr:MAG: hypothetical protein A2748_02495 [Candidatus Wildermuthbacteria bacterium RIFCSPHIGHO2_01_FULL_45_20]
MGGVGYFLLNQKETSSSFREIQQHPQAYDGKEIELTGRIVRNDGAFFGLPYELAESGKAPDRALRIPLAGDNLDAYVSFSFDGKVYTEIANKEVTITGVVRNIGQVTDAPPFHIQVDRIKGLSETEAMPVKESPDALEKKEYPHQPDLEDAKFLTRVLCQDSENMEECQKFVNDTFFENQPLLSGVADKDAALRAYLDEKLGLDIQSIWRATASQDLVVAFLGPIVPERSTVLCPVWFNRRGGEWYGKTLPVCSAYGSSFNTTPLQLVAGQDPFFLLVDGGPYGGTCVPARSWYNLNQFRNGNLEQVWAATRLKATGAEQLMAKVRFEDRNGDGNREIVYEGEHEICAPEEESTCYITECKGKHTKETFEQIYYWDSLQGKFVNEIP